MLAKDCKKTNKNWKFQQLQQKKIHDDAPNTKSNGGQSKREKTSK